MLLSTPPGDAGPRENLILINVPSPNIYTAGPDRGIAEFMVGEVTGQSSGSEDIIYIYTMYINLV